MMKINHLNFWFLVTGTRRVGNMFEHMTKSRKVIIVLSQNYVNDGMNIFELDQATTLLYQDQELEDIIVLKVGDVPTGRVPEHLYTQMRRDRFIEWEEGQNASERFKEKLRDRLQSRMIESTFC